MGLLNTRLGSVCWDWLAELPFAIIVDVMEGIRGTVTSRASALYRKIWDVALKSPDGSAVTIITPFCGARRCVDECESAVDGNEFVNKSSVNLHCRNNLRFGYWGELALGLGRL
jgi:hypothetical protein